MSWTPAAADHVFVLLFAVVYPALGFFSFRRLMRRIEAGYAADRPRLYRHTIAGHWLLLIAGLYLWAATDRPFAVLGFSFDPGPGFLLSLALTLGGIVLLGMQIRAVRRADREFLDTLERSFGALRHLLPRKPRELRGFYTVGITAGVVEEILWRGFLMAYLTQYFSTGVAAAIVIAGFGVAHAYQGMKALPKITLAGALFTAIYLLSGSIWLPIILHACVDVLQGRMAYDVITQRRLYAAPGD